jgi:hypothetical protein
MSTGAASILLDLAFDRDRLYARKQIIDAGAETMYVEFASTHGTADHVALMNGLVHIHKKYLPLPREIDPDVTIQKIGEPLTFEYSDKPLPGELPPDKVILTALLPPGYTISRADPMPNEAKEFAGRVAIHYENFTAAEWRLGQFNDATEAGRAAAVGSLNERASRRAAASAEDDPKQTLYDRWAARPKNNPVTASILLAAAIIVGIAAFTDSLGKIGSFFRSITSTTVEPQEAWWDPRDPNKPVASAIGVKSQTAATIPWRVLKREIEIELLAQVARAPKNGSVELRDAADQPNKLIVVLDADKRDVAHVWYGFDPNNGWANDGRIRIGFRLRGRQRRARFGIRSRDIRTAHTGDVEPIARPAWPPVGVGRLRA